MGNTTLGKVDIQSRATKIEELTDRVNTAIALYKSAQKKFEEGKDSTREWENIVKLLNAEVQNIQRFIAVATHNLGVIHAGKGDLDNARECLETAIDMDPGYAVAYYNLAFVYKAKGDLIKARELLHKAKELGYMK